MNTPVTVLMPFYNPGRFLREAVESVIGQTFTDWKLILIDDGSTQMIIRKSKNIFKIPGSSCLNWRRTSANPRR